jgi:flagellar capping protein FliD
MMTMLLSLPRWVYAVIAAVMLIVGTYFYGHHKGWDERDAEMQAEIARKNEESRATEQRLNEQINDVSNTLTKANNALEKESSALDRAIRAGRVRLPSTSCVQAPSSPSAPVGNRDQAPAESDTETLRLIAQIAADGDRAINQLNACIDAYNQVREQLNGSNR